MPIIVRYRYPRYLGELATAPVNAVPGDIYIDTVLLGIYEYSTSGTWVLLYTISAAALTYLLLEDDFFILLEDDFKLVLE